MNFRHLPIKRALIISTLATNMLALMLAFLALMVMQAYSFINAAVEDLSGTAEVVGINCASAIIFNDSSAAEETLSSLEAIPEVSAACIFGSDGEIFAQYRVDDFLPAPEEMNGDGHEIHATHIRLWRRIVLDDAHIGGVLLKLELDRFYANLLKYLGVLLIIISLAAAISLLAAIRFQNIIVAPLLNLANHMKRVSLEKNYALRIEADDAKTGQSETNLLAIGFNEMLSEIEIRDKALERHQEILEAQVAERTQELSDTNRNLESAIEELREAKKRADMANVAKSDFLANMSHELRTPLNHIIGFTELVVAKHFGDLNPSQDEYLTDVLTSSRHLLSLVNDILDLSKVEAGKLELRPSTVDLKHLLQHSLLMVKEKALTHGLKLTTDLEALPDTVEADERKLKQVVYNLLINAVKFTPDGGKIALSARPVIGTPKPPNDARLSDSGRAFESDGVKLWVEICVRDSGIGIPEKDLSRIFNPFEQVESSRSRKFQGTGLGLSLVKNLVALHGGLVWVESEGKDRGAAFTLAIPAEATP